MTADGTPVDAGTPVVALLRAVNVGGTGKVAMPDLRAAAAELGHQDVGTHLATGNLVLRPRPGFTGTTGDLRAELTAGLRAALGLPLDLVVRSSAEVDGVVAGCAFPDAARDDPSHLLVLFFADPVPEGPVDLGRYGRERGVWRGADGYVHYPDGIGRSRVTADVLVRLAGTWSTGRNWRTVLAVQALLHERLPDAGPR